MNVSEITVKVHRGQVKRKMKARSTPDPFRKAESLGIEPCLRQGGHQPRSSLSAIAPAHLPLRVGDSLRASKSEREPMSHCSGLIRFLQQHECAVAHRFCLQ
jgi:hypothetical protein